MFEEQVLKFVAGVAGGAVLGIVDFVRNKWKDGEKFDEQQFAKSMTLPVAAGLLAAAMAPDVITAFTGGILGKKLQELMAAQPTIASLSAKVGK
jgi:hypothetical protein